jgi:hypothetical protein
LLHFCSSFRTQTEFGVFEDQPNQRLSPGWQDKDRGYNSARRSSLNHSSSPAAPCGTGARKNNRKSPTDAEYYDFFYMDFTADSSSMLSI